MRLNLPRSTFQVCFVLALCVAAFSICGCGGKKPTREEALARYGQELRDAVADKVGDEGRKAQMLQIVDQLEALQVHFSHDTETLVTNYRTLNADYEARRAAFDQLFADYNATRIRARSEALDLHFQLASLATEDEWRSIGKSESKLYEEVGEARPTEATQ
jgi:hypothetical protein